MPFFGAVKCFAEAGGKGGRLSRHIQVGGVPEGVHAEAGDALPPFLGHQSGYGGWSRTDPMP